jgi:hypothetical protein
LLAISTVNAFLTHGTGLVRGKAVDNIIRPFLSTSDGFNSQHEVQKTTATLEDQINQIQSEISATKGRRNELLSSDRDLAIALTGEIVETEKRLRVLMEQQGSLPRIYPFSFPIHSITFCLPNHFRHRIFSCIQVWRRRNVSGDGSSRNIDMYELISSLSVFFGISNNSR